MKRNQFIYILDGLKINNKDVQIGYNSAVSSLEIVKAKINAMTSEIDRIRNPGKYVEEKKKKENFGKRKSKSQARLSKMQKL